MNRHWLILSALVIALSAAHPSVAAQAPTPTKPPLGIPPSSRFFNGKWYYVYLEHGTWQSARDKCVRLSGQLAVVRDGRTQEFIKELASDLVLWLGATDEKVEGLWMWVDGAQMGFQAWNASEPNNYQGREHYLVTTRGGLWGDTFAKERVVGFICEWKAK